VQPIQPRGDQDHGGAEGRGPEGSSGGGSGWLNDCMDGQEEGADEF
jgi:hypothetical protein